MQTLDEMLNRHFLSADQHAQIASHIAALKSPEAIARMPAHLWRALELASVLLGFDADITQAPCYEPD